MAENMEYTKVVIEAVNWRPDNTKTKRLNIPKG